MIEYLFQGQEVYNGQSQRNLGAVVVLESWIVAPTVAEAT